LALIGIAHQFYQSTTAGRTISESLWGLNLLHYSKILEKVSRNEGRDLEKKLLGYHTDSLSEAPNLSYPSGIYPSGIQVKIDLPPGTIGYYSLDGSVPTRRHHPVTAKDIPIAEPTVLRVKAFDGSATSRVVTAEYIISDLVDFSVASLVMDPVYLFDRHSGIYANPTQKGRGWERPATLSIFGPTKGDSLSMDVRVRIQGGASRGS
jgi:hypothetical protein